MKGLLFIYAMTAFGVLGGLVAPIIGLFVYVGFATLRPQFLWSFAGDLGGISQYVAIAMLIGWAAKGFGSYSVRRATIVVAPLLLFAAWTFVSSQTAANSAIANAWSIEFLKILAPFLVGITTLYTTKHARWLLWVIVGSLAYISYHMNLQYYGGFNEVSAYGFGGMDSNSFGVSLVAAVGPAIALGLSARTTKERGLAFLCALLILHTILLTFSRGAMIGLIVAIVAAFVIMPKRPAYIGGVVLVCLLGIRLAGTEVVDEFSSTFVDAEERDTSAQSRVDLWSACWDMAIKSPLVGVGPRNFPVHAASYGFTDGKEAHSTWMQTLAETGFPGLAALVGFFVMAIVRLWPMARQKWTAENSEDSLLAAGIVSSLAGFFVSAQFVTMTGLETPYYITMAGAILIGKRVLERSAETSAIVAAPSPAVAVQTAPPLEAQPAYRVAGPASPRRRTSFQWDATPPDHARGSQV